VPAGRHSGCNRVIRAEFSSNFDLVSMATQSIRKTPVFRHWPQTTPACAKHQKQYFQCPVGYTVLGLSRYAYQKACWLLPAEEQKLGPAAIAKQLGIGRASVYRVSAKSRRRSHAHASRTALHVELHLKYD
jgi:hypothetical protein